MLLTRCLLNKRLVVLVQLIVLISCVPSTEVVSGKPIRLASLIFLAGASITVEVRGISLACGKLEFLSLLSAVQRHQ
jgi:hypothetical protein